MLWRKKARALLLKVEEPFPFESRLEVSIAASGLWDALAIRQNQTGIRVAEMIEGYDYGVLRIDGKEYHSDVIIYPDSSLGGCRVDGSWWRKEGHRVDRADVENVVKARPDVLVVGTGYYGCMEVPTETKELLKDAGIELCIEPTLQACDKYNQLKAVRKVAAALHLTC